MMADVVPNGLGTAVDSTTCLPSCTVTGGSTRGTNLFHSFDEFSLPSGSTSTFRHDAAISTIITRVTGGSTSRINGTLETLLEGSLNDRGSADFFFVNPSGIVFGPNAQLNIGGSFIGSTAESLVFEDGTEFTVDAANPLLTISAPVGLQLGTGSGNIRVAGSGSNVVLNPDDTINRSDRPTGLSVVSGNTLALVGRNLRLDGGNLTAEAGRIELAAVTSGPVTLNETRAGWTFDYGTVDTFGNLALADAASADVSGDDAGTIHLQGRTITLDDGSSLLANTLVAGGGNIRIDATDSLQMTGTTATPSEPFRALPSSAYIEISPGAVGDGSSTLTVATTDLTLTDGAQIGLSMGGLGVSGSVNVEADTIIANRDAPTAFSGLFAAVLPVFPSEESGLPPSLGTGGNLNITTNRLQVSNGAQILVSTFGIGEAGNLTINAQEIEVFGFSDFGSSSLQAASEFPPSGNGGQLTINTERLLVADGGQISTSTKSFAASAGDLVIRASESVELSGTTPFGRSGLFATAVSLRNPETGEVATAAGEGGNILIETDSLTLRDGAIISVSSNPSNPNNPGLAPGVGPAGNVTLVADLILVDDQSVLSADTANGDRANTFLQSDLIVFLDDSQLTTNATGAATGGNIETETTFLVASANSDITANATESFGGRVIITAEGIFGTEFRALLTAESDITATSALGPQFSGVVEINSPDVDPSRSTAQLPSSLLATREIVETCDPYIDSRFTLVGRGGLSPTPYQTSTAGQLVWRDFRLSDDLAPNNRAGQSTRSTYLDARGLGDLAPEENTVVVPTDVSDQTQPPQDTIREAQGLEIGDNGQIRLVASQATLPRQSPLVETCPRFPASIQR
ncbi:MAG: filamentous hemagglutinin N-terminal domain-containing protein [Leptolyngbyaceae cyanobacterium]